ncbi:MAG: transposase, partial [Candidatus Accumulibacter sp.]|nr:transposase [Accumulibacter sp.]
LHNNHHAYVSSARFSNRWWELDLGWMYIRILESLHLAKVRRVAPRVHFNPAKTRCDAATLQAVITHRYEVLARFARSMRQTTVDEIRGLRARAIPGLTSATALDATKRWLQADARDLPEHERVVLERAFHASVVLSTIGAMRQDLSALWSRSTRSTALLTRHLEEWCRLAEESGIGALREFSRTLRRYDL